MTKQELLKRLIDAAYKMRAECGLWGDALDRWDPFYWKRAKAMREALSEYDRVVGAIERELEGEGLSGLQATGTSAETV